MVSDISDFFNKIKNERTVLSYIGNLTPELVASIIQDLEDGLIKKNEDSKVVRKLYNVLVELLQNLYHHTDQVTPDEYAKNPSSICVVDNNDNYYEIITGNYIKNDKVQSFQEHLSNINLLSKDELKDFYLDILDNGRKSNKDGAGLGMIDIARKTGDKLHFEFIPVLNNYSLFILKTKILK